VKTIIERITTCLDDELTNVLSEFTRWEFPKGDLNHWIGPLNRFDGILDKAVKEHGFRDTPYKIQEKPFSEELAECLCQIMRVTVLLFHNCSFRTLYGSSQVTPKLSVLTQQIVDLIGSTDLDVVEMALRLVTCFAARTAQRVDPGNNTFVIPRSRLWKFATAESLYLGEGPVPANWSGYHFNYYKRASTTVGVPAKTAVSPGATRHETEEDTKVTEGWVRLVISPESVAAKGIDGTFRELVSQANIPKEDQFRLFVQISMVYYVSDPIRREQFIRCQLSAICALGTPPCDMD
jgi:hypothetical protein